MVDGGRSRVKPLAALGALTSRDKDDFGAAISVSFEATLGPISSYLSSKSTREAVYSKRKCGIGRFAAITSRLIARTKVPLLSLFNSHSKQMCACATE